MKKNIRLVDAALAAAVGLAVFALLAVWPFPGIHPKAWTDVAVSSGALPQCALLPGFGSFIARALFKTLPFGTALAADVLLAKLAVSVSAALLCAVFSVMLRLATAQGARDLARRRTARRIASVVAAFSFGLSEPVWISAQGFSGATFVMFLTILTLFFFVRLLATARFSCAVAALASAGFLTAETPLGWLVLVFCILATVRLVAINKTADWELFLDPMRLQRTKWTMTFVFIGALLVGILLEGVAFALCDGLHAVGITAGDLPTAYAEAYWGRLAGCGSPLGLALFAIAAVVPCALALVMSASATDEERYLSFKHSLVFFITGFIAFLQLAPFAFAWFWRLAPGATVSRPLLLFAMLLDAVVLAWALFVLGVEIFCRNYRHIENVLYKSFGDRDDDENAETTARPARPEPEARPGEDADEPRSVRLTVGRLLMLVVPILIVALLVPGRRLSDDRALLDVVYRFVNETLDELVGVKYLFTDGSYDDLIRLEAHRRGLDVTPVSLMSGKSRADAYIRQLGTEAFEDRMTLETGAAEALRTWVLAKSQRLSSVAVQLAFEIFRLNRRCTPIVYGALVRPMEGVAADAAKSVARCHALADEIVAMHESGVWRHAKDDGLKDLFLFAQFRLAVMSRLRAIELDQKGQVKESLEEIAYSDRLNMNNPSLVKILKRMDWVRRQSGEALTPREGLEVALKRADFVMARRYAMPVLHEDPDEPNANFAVGMSYYAEEQFAKAEEYLKRVLKRHPKEAAVYNNVALICLKTKRLDEAAENAAKALKLAPKSPEVQDTVRQIEKARADAASKTRR